MAKITLQGALNSSEKKTRKKTQTIKVIRSEPNTLNILLKRFRSDSPPNRTKATYVRMALKMLHV